MKNLKYAVILLLVLGIWGWNNILLNSISQKDKAITLKQREVTALQKKYDNKMVEYDAAVNLESIKKDLLKEGFKPTNIIWFELDN